MTINSIPVLMYHHINHHAGDTVTVIPEVFSAQMEFLRDEGYQTLSADELMELIQGKLSFNQKSVAITFDDGWLDNYQYAAPVLANCKFKATFFVITDRVDAASMRARMSSADVPDHETAKKLIECGAAEQVVMGWDIIRELEADQLFRFYSHTVTHLRCAGLTDRDLQSELAHSKERLESQLGKSCDYLCWPYGSFSTETVKSASLAGYKGLFTTIDGYCDSGSDPFMIKRIEVKNSVQSLKSRLFQGSL
jgi:peptidoglycan/xylan/chitin deacetylase (PgdA/CDA1 family)